MSPKASSRIKDGCFDPSTADTCHTQDRVAKALNLGHVADEEIISLLTSKTAPPDVQSHKGPHHAPREQGAATRPTEQAQHASHVSHGSRLASQRDSGVQNVPSQAAPRKRPLPHSFRPVKRAAFIPPRGSHGGSQPSHHAARPSQVARPAPPVNAQPTISNGPWPLSLRSSNQQQAASRSLAAKQPPSQKDAGISQWLGLSPGSAKLDQGKQRRLPVLATRPGTGSSSGVAPGRAADELCFSAAGAQQPVRLCTVPDVIKGGAAEYASVWLPAVYEELNLQ